MSEFNFRYLCTPAKIYFAIAVIAAVFAIFNGAALMGVFMNLVFAFLWTLVLGWLCKKGLKAVSWILVIMPFVLMFVASKNRYTSELLEGLAGNYGDPWD